MHQQLLFAPLYRQIQANEQEVESHLPSYKLTPDNHKFVTIQTKCMYYVEVLEEANLTRVLTLLFS